MNDNLREQWAALPVNLANHLEITLVALLAGVALSLPLAVLLVRSPRLRFPVLAAAGVVQTVPSLALLALMVPVIVYTGGFGVGVSAFGFYPAVIALTLYSVLPVLRNAVTGILGVDPSLTEAARGVGMSERQVLWHVQLPLAAPVIVAGIRTATAWVIGMATLATPVGQTCLGNYIFAGLQTRNWVMVMFGVVAAAVLAVAFDLLIGGIERAATARRRRAVIGYAVALAALVVVGLAAPRFVSVSGPAVATADSQPGAPATERPSEPAETGALVIGAKTFSEQYILAALLRDRLADAGIAATVADSLGSTVVFDALVNGDVDVYVDYSGTIWANYMKREDAAPGWRVLRETGGWLARDHGVRQLGALGFENAYALAVRRADAERLGLATIDDLAAPAGDLTIGGDYEFFSRPEWRALRDGYGLAFAEQRSLDSTLMYEALAAGEVDVISAFSSDGRIAAYDLVVLEDPRQVIPPYDAVVLLGAGVAGRSDVVGALRPLIGAIDVANMRRANYMVDREDEKRTPATAARWLRDQLTLAD